MIRRRMISPLDKGSGFSPPTGRDRPLFYSMAHRNGGREPRPPGCSLLVVDDHSAHGLSVRVRPSRSGRPHLPILGNCISTLEDYFSSFPECVFSRGAIDALQGNGIGPIQCTRPPRNRAVLAV